MLYHACKLIVRNIMSGLKKSQHLSIPLNDIQVATNNFETCIGKGGFGQVYKGQLSISGILTTVAVKRLNDIFGQGLKEFLTEIDLLTGQRHPNLVSLLGYCDEEKEKLIVYEYAERGSLDQYITHSVNPTYTLTWPERLKICIDVARGLDHLHNHVGKHQTIIHRDIKSANILLDENWVAKISDFGLSKLCLAGLGRSAIISHACGTRGYCEPEYIISGIVTKKSDVYSFGMVLFEVLCGKLCNNVDKNGVLSAKSAKECYENDKLHDIIDTSLMEQMRSNALSKFSAIAYRCLLDDREQRPTMDVVKKELEETLKIQVSNIIREESLSRRNKEKLFIRGEGTTDAAQMDTKTVAVQPILVPPALQVDELKLSLRGEGTTDAAPMDTKTVAVQPIPVPPALQVDELKLPLWGDVTTEATPVDAQTVAIQPISISFPAPQVDELMEITDNFGKHAFIGEGMLGREYYGVLKNGQTATVKVLNRTNQPDQELSAQIPRTKMLLDDVVITKQAQKEDEATKMLYDDVVIIRHALKEDDASVITINCPDKIGLGCDLCRILLFFGLSIVRGDVSTDGKWCYIVFWVIGKPGTIWSLLKKRLLEACPSIYSANELVYYRPQSELPKPADVSLLKFYCYDRKGLLHDVTHLLCELELVIQRVKVSTTPDGMVMNLFFITDARELLHTAERKQDIFEKIKVILGDAIISYDIAMAGPEFTTCSHGLPSFIPPAITEAMLESNCLNSVSVTLDNSLSPSHTLVQIYCHDHKGLLYDIMRLLKDCNIQISYGRFTRQKNKDFELDFFIMQADGKKIVDPSKQNALCSRMRIELFCPLRIVLVNRGPDTELLVANHVELCGKGRPLVFYDITNALKMLNMDIFSADVCRHLIGGQEWEVNRILLDEGDSLFMPKGRIEEAVRNMLMGWNRS